MTLHRRDVFYARFREKYFNGMQTTSVLENQVIDVLRTCYDAEIPVNIYEMGLIYGIEIDPLSNVGITMTLTSPMCPVAESIPREVDEKVRAIPGVNEVNVQLVWDPTWTPSMMSEAARLQLGFM